VQKHELINRSSIRTQPLGKGKAMCRVVRDPRHPNYPLNEPEDSLLFWGDDLEEEEENYVEDSWGSPTVSPDRTALFEEQLGLALETRMSPQTRCRTK